MSTEISLIQCFSAGRLAAGFFLTNLRCHAVIIVLIHTEKYEEKVFWRFSAGKLQEFSNK